MYKRRVGMYIESGIDYVTFSAKSGGVLKKFLRGLKEYLPHKKFWYVKNRRKELEKLLEPKELEDIKEALEILDKC